MKYKKYDLTTNTNINRNLKQTIKNVSNIFRKQ
jgi:hypothetical protein